jgi:hypothetical protein
MAKRYTIEDVRVLAKQLDLPKPVDGELLEQLRAGIEIEHEHDDLIKGDPLASGAIAAAHLREDRLYYLPLMALERFRHREKQTPGIRFDVRGYPGNVWRVCLHVEGVKYPIETEAFETAEQADAVMSFLKHHSPLARVYVWMILSRYTPQ